MSGGETPTNKHSVENLEQMSRDDLVALGTNLDGVDVAFRKDRWPVEGTTAEKRAERKRRDAGSRSPASQLSRSSRSTCSGRGSTQGPGDENYGLYNLYTPLHRPHPGSVDPRYRCRRGAVHEEVHPRRGVDPGSPRRWSTEVDRKTIVAELGDSLDTSTLPRRKLIKRSRIFGGGALGVSLIMPLGGLIKNPWATGRQVAAVGLGLDSELRGRDHLPASRHRTARRTSSWFARRISTPAAWRRSSRSVNPTVVTTMRCCRACAASATPVMLIRLRTEDAERAIKRKGQESFNYGDYFALLEDLHPPRLPHLAVRAAEQPHSLPVPPVAVRRTRVRQADLRSRCSCTAAAAYYSERRGLPGRRR